VLSILVLLYAAPKPSARLTSLKRLRKLFPVRYSGLKTFFGGPAFNADTKRVPTRISESTQGLDIARGESFQLECEWTVNIRDSFHKRRTLVFRVRLSIQMSVWEDAV
jgi:hypothetical protein